MRFKDMDEQREVMHSINAALTKLVGHTRENELSDSVCQSFARGIKQVLDECEALQVTNDPVIQRTIISVIVAHFSTVALADLMELYGGPRIPQEAAMNILACSIADALMRAVSPSQRSEFVGVVTAQHLSMNEFESGKRH